MEKKIRLIDADTLKVDGIKSEYYMECYGEECPYYVPEKQYSYGITTQAFCDKVDTELRRG